MIISAVIETSKDQASRLQRLDPSSRTMTPAMHPMVVLDIKPSERRQTILGFGAALTEAVHHVLGALTPSDRQGVLEQHFGPEGQGYTLTRTHLNSCDFSLGHWTTVQSPGDVSLSSFSMAKPDECLVPLLKDVQELTNGKIHIMVTPWSPPGWMKDNGRMDQGGRLLPQYRGAWADTYVRYFQELRARGIEVWALSIQNEPAAVQRWDSCIWTAAEEADFAVAFLKPRLEAAGFSHIKIFAWDHNRDLLLERAQDSLARPGALDAIDGLGFHWYSGDQYDQVAACAKLWPEKLLVFTEGCVEGGPRMGAWYTGERYAHNILNDLNAGAHGWIDWNLALDTRGGPNHAENYCDAPVLVDTTSKIVHYQSSFWYMGHISRYVKPGAVCLASSLWVGWVPASADGRGGHMIDAGTFENPDGTLVAIIMNRTEADLPYRLTVEGHPGGYDLFMPARSIHTLLINTHSAN